MKADFDRIPSAAELPVLIYAPYGNDGDTLHKVLTDAGFTAIVADDLAQFQTSLAREAGVLIVSQEGLTEKSLELVSQMLAQQDDWAELPIIVLLDAALHLNNAAGRLLELMPRSKLIIKQRPVHPTEMTTSVDTALRARIRQYALARYIAHQEELRHELNHRVKNILASVNALFSLTRRNSADLNEFSHEFAGRLNALSNVHSVLFNVDYGLVWLTELVEAILRPFNTEDVRVVATGPDQRLLSDPAQKIALSLYELATNAAKYGALSSSEGAVGVKWSVESGTGGDSFVLDWSESGGPSVKPPSRTGYGTRFIRSAAHSLDGEANLEFTPAGLHVQVRVPARSVLDR
ncbi:sensor histidine kinase [Aurantimonas sp. C2-6-R+9]|uniref:sensor histidine kinase n=1 Tax=unclassified Aurantimonas TaxID=2638230 RepID=UPI002E186E5F|nr:MULTISPECIES: sensor histidine kinase [unclassified Aurantimonas]MEC5293135.1 sensor histidine kinase [Aurantimonas sp. C2-3-R2]MEC5383461.1 sensor histidine kinase [Aurantimonas sp. C2-6-R+9]MEC5414218.1 sensor histidine kinase [Aurantimonas sp. C2-4-R8]